MTNVAIRVEGLSKQYRIGGKRERYRTLRDTLTNGFAAPARRLASVVRGQSTAASDETIWALKDVSFEVERGEVVGVIGRNGAGKTTLLKILSRITEPTEGYAEIHGRVASLLEVGTGFHSELTGRENIYLNGAILGMKRAEIDRKFDEIVDFSGVEKFIDTPVKHYSSGMYVRLAFAVAAHLEPEILLVDEVLAVGDVAFRKKCLGKMSEVASEGRTVLFVSHNMGAIRSMTNCCIHLQEGNIVGNGETAEVVDHYLAISLQHGQQMPGDLDFYRRDKINCPVRFKRIWVGDTEGSLAEIPIGKDIVVWMVVESDEDFEETNITIDIKSVTGYIATTILSWDSGFRPPLDAGLTLVCCRIKGIHLSPGRYLLNLGINRAAEGGAWDAILDYPGFVVSNNGDNALLYRAERPGVVLWPSVAWEYTQR